MASADERLLAAARSGNLDMLDKVLQDGTFNINAIDGGGNSALHLAAEYGRTDIVSQLLTVKGINVNAIKKTDGSTPLHKAACPRVDLEAEAVRIVEMLINAGANVKQRNKECRTAFQITRYESIKNILRQAVMTLDATSELAVDDNDDDSAEE